ncbi:hypothetical protein [Alkalihalobacillus sp. LMS39]|uniref:hypothetical protein n=1 Tax=Alkalihalobacillus sp. LMS39 TaxID=2924032 RepID=UPI001FB4A3F0|nr:hypothetical protein [Alkalihalobacillus sp. LMS39]UOE95477.1 hypothetical protein MM271_07660 [Alkalihalobacillus sp. LMS39]
MLTELTLDIPIMWLFIGMSFVYVIAIFQRNVMYHPYCYKYERWIHHDVIQDVHVQEPRLSLRWPTFCQRKIPSLTDKSHSDEEDRSPCVY